jgi:DNA replication protein DnaC
MSDSITVDTARLPLLLGELRLPTVGKLWQAFTERADREGWPSARLLATLAELELAERAQRRIQRHLLEARLPPGKTLGSFDFASVPMVSHAHVTALASGDAWLKKGANILLFGPSGPMPYCTSRYVIGMQGFVGLDLVMTEAPVDTHCDPAQWRPRPVA